MGEGDENLDCWAVLAMAVLRQAVLDLKRKSRALRTDAETFLAGPWGKTLTEVLGLEGADLERLQSQARTRNWREETVPMRPAGLSVRRHAEPLSEDAPEPTCMAVV